MTYPINMIVRYFNKPKFRAKVFMRQQVHYMKKINNISMTGKINLTLKITI